MGFISVKYHLRALLMVVGLSYTLSCADKRYPCPAYDNKSQAKMDSSGAFAGGYRHNRDKKTGLIKKKKNRNLYDRKSSNARVF